MKRRSTHSVNISVSMPVELRDAGKQAAFDDNRSFSSLLCVLLQEYLGRERYLAESSCDTVDAGRASSSTD